MTAEIIAELRCERCAEREKIGRKRLKGCRSCKRIRRAERLAAERATRVLAR